MIGYDKYVLAQKIADYLLEDYFELSPGAIMTLSPRGLCSRFGLSSMCGLTFCKLSNELSDILKNEYQASALTLPARYFDGRNCCVAMCSNTHAEDELKSCLMHECIHFLCYKDEVTKRDATTDTDHESLIKASLKEHPTLVDILKKKHGQDFISSTKTETWRLLRRIYRYLDPDEIDAYSVTCVMEGGFGSKIFEKIQSIKEGVAKNCSIADSPWNRIPYIVAMMECENQKNGDYTFPRFLKPEDYQAYNAQGKEYLVELETQMAVRLSCYIGEVLATYRSNINSILDGIKAINEKEYEELPFAKVPIEDLPAILYHATSSERISSIEAHGLGSMTRGNSRYDYGKKEMLTKGLKGAFLANSSGLAYDFLDNSPIFWNSRVEEITKGGVSEKIVVLGIRTEDLDPDKLYLDPNFMPSEDGDQSYFYHGIIPYDKLKEVNLPDYPSIEKKSNSTCHEVGDLYYIDGRPVGVVVASETEESSTLIMSLSSFDLMGKACQKECFMDARQACEAADRYHTHGTSPGDWFLPSEYCFKKMGALHVTRSARFNQVRDSINQTLEGVDTEIVTLLNKGYHYWTCTRFVDEEKGINVLMNSGGTSYAENSTKNCVRAFMAVDRDGTPLESREAALRLSTSYRHKYSSFYARKAGTVICVCGGMNAGKSTMAHYLQTERTVVLDGDALRKNINEDLTYGSGDSNKGSLRVAKMAEYLSLQGFDVVVSTIRADRVYNTLKNKVRDLILVSLWRVEEGAQKILCTAKGIDNKEYEIVEGQEPVMKFVRMKETGVFVASGCTASAICQLPNFSEISEPLKKILNYKRKQ